MFLISSASTNFFDAINNKSCIFFFRNQTPKEVRVILWDQTTAQIFPVHRVLCVSMAALPMNLNARILKQKVKREKKTRISRPRSHSLCNLGL